MKKFWSMLGMLLIPTLCFAGVTSTTTWVSGQPVKIIKASWTSDTFSSVGYVELDRIDGFVFGVLADPTGTVLDNYDVYLYGYDTNTSLLGTAVENQHTTSSKWTYLTSGTMVPYYGTAGFSVTGVGDLEAGDVYFYIQVPK